MCSSLRQAEAATQLRKADARTHHFHTVTKEGKHAYLQNPGDVRNSTSVAPDFLQLFSFFFFFSFSCASVFQRKLQAPLLLFGRGLPNPSHGSDAGEKTKAVSEVKAAEMCDWWVLLGWRVLSVTPAQISCLSNSSAAQTLSSRSAAEWHHRVCGDFPLFFFPPPPPLPFLLLWLHRPPLRREIGNRL